MHGFITTTDVVAHAALIVREFGVRCLLRCLRGAVLGGAYGRKVTFLECI